MWLLNLKTIVLKLLMSSVATAVVSELYLGCRFVGQFLQLALCLKNIVFVIYPLTTDQSIAVAKLTGLDYCSIPQQARTLETLDLFLTRRLQQHSHAATQFIRAPAAGCCNGSSE